MKIYWIISIILILGAKAGMAEEAAKSQVELMLQPNRTIVLGGMCIDKIPASAFQKGERVSDEEGKNLGIIRFEVKASGARVFIYGPPETQSDSNFQIAAIRTHENSREGVSEIDTIDFTKPLKLNEDKGKTTGGRFVPLATPGRSAGSGGIPKNAANSTLTHGKFGLFSIDNLAEIIKKDKNDFRGVLTDASLHEKDLPIPPRITPLASSKSIPAIDKAFDRFLKDPKAMSNLEKRLNALPASELEPMTSSCEAHAAANNQRLILVAAQANNVSIAGLMATRPRQDARPPELPTLPGTPGSPESIAKAFWTPAVPLRVAYLIEPHGLRIDLGDEISPKSLEAEYRDSAANALAKVKDFFDEMLSLTDSKYKNIQFDSQGSPVESIRDPLVWGGKIQRQKGVNAMLENRVALVFGTGDLGRLAREYAENKLGWNLKKQVVVARADRVTLADLALDEAATETVTLESFPDKQVEIDYDLIDGTIVVAQGDFFPRGVSPWKTKLPASKFGSLILSNAFLTAEARLEFLRGKAPALNLKNLTLAARTIQDERGGVVLIGGQMHAQEGIFQVTPSTSIRYLRVDSGALKGIQTTTSEIAVRLDESDHLTGRGSMQADALSSNGVSNAHLNLNVRPTGLGSLSYFLTLPYDEEVTLNLKANGDWDALLVSGSIDAPKLSMDSLNFSSLDKIDFGPIVIHYQQKSIHMPIDIDTKGPAGELRIGAEKKEILQGSLDHLRLRGTLIIDGPRSRIEFEPGGLEINLSGAATTRPWVAGGKPEFGKIGVKVRAPEGFAISSNGAHGKLLVAAESLTVLNPNIELSTTNPQLKASPPLRTTSSVAMLITLPDEALEVQEGRFESQGPFGISALTDEPIKLSEIFLTRPSITVDRLSLDYKRSQAVAARLENLSINAKLIEMGGRAGVRKDASDAYWSVEPGQLVVLKELKADGVKIHEGFQLNNLEIKDLQISSGPAKFYSRDGFRYEGRAISAAIPSMDKNSLSAELRLGEGSVGATTKNLVGSVKLTKLQIHLSGTPQHPLGSLDFSFRNADFTAATPMELRFDKDGCDRGSSAVQLETTVKIPAFNAHAKLVPGGDIAGYARVPDLTVRPVLNKNFYCSWVHDFKWEWVDKVCWRVLNAKDCKRIVWSRGRIPLRFTAGMDHFRMGIGASNVQWRLSKGTAVLCRASLYLAEPALTNFAITPTPEVSHAHIDRILAEATNTIARPFQALFFSSFLNAGVLGAQILGVNQLLPEC